MMSIKRVVVVGGGTLGSQIAYQTAFKGFTVTIYDINADAIAAARKRVATWDKAYAHDVQATAAAIDATHERLSYSTTLADAVADADLVIEAVPEVVAIKQSLYEQLAKVAPEKTIFTTNTSSFLPSQFADATGRPQKFLALHFVNHVWKNNMAEIMGHAGTDPEVYAKIVDFAKKIGMITVELKKEQPAYVLNTLLIPFVGAALVLWAKDVADVETIDRTWMLSTKAPIGPFGMLDVVGLRTAYNIFTEVGATPGHADLAAAAEKMKTELLDQGEIGVETGHGFYDYPEPAFQRQGFVLG